MPDTTVEQQVQATLAGALDRSNYDQVAASIYESFGTVDATYDCMKGLVAKLQGASEDEQRDLHERIGILSYALGEFDAALEQLECVKMRKEAAHFLGRVYMEVGRMADALTALEAGRRAADDFGTDLLVVDALCDQREPEKARKLCEKYRKSHGEESDWLCAMGRVLETEGEYGEAMQHYEQALQKAPEHRLGLFRLALNCDLNGDDARAMELYLKCASLKPAFLGAIVNVGILYEDQGKFERAIDCYRRVLAMDPAHPRVRMYLKDAEASLTMFVDEDQRRKTRAHDEVLQLSISNFELSARSRHVLEKLGVRTLGDLAARTEQDLLEFRNFGETSLDEIRELLSRNGLQLGSAGLLEGEAGGAEAPSDEMREVLNMPIELLSLSTRSRKCMERLTIATVAQLVEHTEEELLTTPNFGRTSINEIKAKLAEYGLTLREE
jgi:DNA-directed RNA polymerase subunit alpha